MRYLVHLLVLAAAAAPADANTRIVVMTDADDLAAIEVALAGRGAEVAPAPAPQGALRLDRAALAQRSTVDQNAAAAVWIDQEPAEVCVVSADGRQFRHAPLPADAASPRVFAAIAASLLDEVLEPGPPPINVDVHVDVQPVPIARPAVVAPAIATPAAASRIAGALAMLEVGPLVTTGGFGAEAAVTFLFTRSTRIGVVGVASDNISDDVGKFGGVGVEVRHVGEGKRHLDLGAEGGVADTHERGTTPWAALRLGVTWETAESAMTLALSPALINLDFARPSGAAWLSLRWLLPM